MWKFLRLLFVTVILGLAVTPAAILIYEGAGQEDGPDFNCRTDGNRICGVPDEDGVTLLVHFDKLGEPIRATRQ
ncbi:hypothetical protein JNUCC0626_40310 [Lentzea sp. JNUCC 0626]|uniref:hypothetical protein n=1 Tax=Lentzea sp. JNUCC 0626 TaxID=3367513 RepID=UPI003749DFA4